jgi:hypothetical protein
MGYMAAGPERFGGEQDWRNQREQRHPADPEADINGGGSHYSDPNGVPRNRLA